MKKLFLLAGLVSLLFAVGCGSNNGSTTTGPTPTNENFTDTSLSGQYAYEISGTDLTNPLSSFLYNRAGVFTANGAGTITTGTDDFAEGGTAISSSISGVYVVNTDGTGTITLDFAGGGTVNLAITLVNSSKVYMVDADSTLVGGGIAELQTTSAFTTIPSGSFAFHLHTIDNVPNVIGTAGVLSVDGTGGITGTDDVNENFSTNQRNITTGLLNAPDTTTGRGTGNFVDDSGNPTFTFNYYVVNSSTLLLFSTVSGQIGLGRAEKQSGTFSNSSLNGSYAWGLRGDSSLNFDGVHTVGRFTANNGTISSGAFDGVRDGVPSTNVSYTGPSFSVASNGRAVLTITPSTGGSTQHIYYLVSPSRAFFLTDDPNAIAEGTASLQSGSFSNSTVNGQFALLMGGFDLSPESVDRIATLTADGAGHLTLDELESDSGSVTTPGLITGTYSVSSNGRMTGMVSGVSNNLIFYLVSGTDGYVLQNDANVEVSGVIGRQP